MARSRIILVCLVALLAVGLWYPPTPPPRRISEPGGDIVLFRAVVDRMRAGEPYYGTMRAELRSRGYPTASIFNWRPPVTFWLMASLPTLVHALMLILGIVATGLTVWVFRGASAPITIAAIALILGSAVLPFVPRDGLYLPELWAGLFLLFSLLAYMLGAVRLAVCCAVLAVCARELAMPYVLAGLALALHERRATEVRWYVGGLVLFAVYYVAHVSVAASHIQAGDMSHTFSWVSFGGWPFVVTTVGMGGWLMILPRWCAAIGAVIVLASLWGPVDRHLRMMVAIYLAAFSVVGQPFNNSWGLLTGPAWGLAMIYGVMGLHRLLRSSIATAANRDTPVTV